MTVRIHTAAFAAAAAFTAAALVLMGAPALAAEPTSVQPAGGAAITLTFDTADQTGKVMVALYDSETAYSGGKPAAVAMVDVAAGEHEATFDLPAGDYAVKAFHDLNGDGQMNTNPFGMPTEPYAFSNNAHGNMGPATWAQAHFPAEGATAQTISIR